MDTKDIAAFNLVGQTLNATWVVKQRIDKEPSGTGGFFSVCYLVEDRLHNNFFLVHDKNWKILSWIIDYQLIIFAKDLKIS